MIATIAVLTYVFARADVPPAITITPAIIAGGAATLLSILATYVPGFNTWHAGLSTETKKLFWLVVLLVVTIGAVTWGCNAATECIIVGWKDYVTVFVSALVAAIGGNQGIHLLLPEPNAVVVAREIGKLKRGKK